MWWRKYRDLMYKFNARMIERFTEAETQLCNEIFEKEHRAKNKRPTMAPALVGNAAKRGTQVGKMVLTKEERVKLMLTPDDDVQYFIAQEMRYYRFKHLAKLAAHKILYTQYTIDMREYREEKEAAALMGLEWEEEKHTKPERPPYPVLLVTDEELQEMMQRCRVDPENFSVIETTETKRRARTPMQQTTAEDLESLNTKKRQALEKLSARDYLPRIPHPDGPDAPFM